MDRETCRGVVKPPTRGAVATAAGFALLLAAGGLQAATCSIGTTPNPPTINVGQSVAFTGTVTGKAPLTYTWAFAGGTPASATTKSVTVSYASAGSFAATLNGKNGRNETCTANVTVQVNAVGNSPPVAQNDQYNTQQNTQLVVAAPGVLSNDNDPNGNPITAGWNGVATPVTGLLYGGGVSQLLAQLAEIGAMHSRMEARDGIFGRRAFPNFLTGGPAGPRQPRLVGRVAGRVPASSTRCANRIRRPRARPHPISLRSRCRCPTRGAGTLHCRWRPTPRRRGRAW